MRHHLYIAALVASSILSCCLQGHAQENGGALTSLSLEELMTVQVISASKKAEDFFKTPAAVFVINQQDIRRSGATSLPEILRMVPGVQVARINGNQWAVTARGFNSHFADKLLVLMDGRVLYSPLHAGVYWDVQDTLLEDIDRIEVIRGSGATLWGANAVNGVINIITRKAAETQGGLIVAGLGTEDAFFASTRYGGTMGEDAFYRLYGKFFERASLDTISGADGEDGWHQGRFGFRIDWQRKNNTSYTLQGDAYRGRSGRTKNSVLLEPPYTDTFSEDVDVIGANLLGRWQHDFSTDNQVELQFYYDHTERYQRHLDEHLETFDIDLQHRFLPLASHSLVWGMGYRYFIDKLRGSEQLSFNSPSRHYYLINCFLQDDITLVDDKLHFILGSKLENGSFSDTAIQPNARLLWLINPRNTLWAAVSKTVRATSRGDQDIRILLAAFPDESNTLNLLTLFGNNNTVSKNLEALEVGYRTHPWDAFFFDIALYYNIYEDLRSVEQGRPYYNDAGNRVIPLLLSNKRSGKSFGVEISGKWQVTSWWQLSAGYNYYSVDIDLDADSTDTTETGLLEEDQPEYQVNLRSHFDLPAQVTFDTSLYYVDELTSLGIDDYLRLDLRLGWQPVPSVDLSVVMANVLDDQHLEYVETDGLVTSAIERSLYAELTYRF